MRAGSSGEDRRTAAERPSLWRILAALRGDRSRTVVHWKRSGITADELAHSLTRSATALSRAGVEAGDTVGILTESNHPRMLTARYAGHLLGAAVVHLRSMNPRSDAEALPVGTQADILRDTGASVVVVDDANAPRGRELSALVPGTTVLDTLACDTEHEPAAFPERSPDNLAVVDFTSGSTGHPRMVKHSVATQERTTSLLVGDERTHPRTLLSVTPISHTTAPMVDAVLSRGGRIVLHDGFDADEVLTALAEQRVSDVYLAVPHLYRLVDHPGIADADLTSLRRVVYSGTPAAPARIARAVEVFGDRLIQVYGTTEAGGITSLDPLDHREPELLGSVGRPFPWVELELRDPESDLAAEPGEVGEVCVASPTVMDGYLGQPELTRRVLEAGWLRTGDLGRWDKYGYLRLVGRVGDAIKSGGLKLDPAVIAGVLREHPRVREAAVYGVRDDDYVEHVHAAVELREGPCTTAELRAHVAAELTPTHVPADIAVWPELPLRPTGKPDYALLRTRRG